MSKKLAFALILVILISQFAVSAAFAAPAGSCAPGFTLEMAMEHDEHHHQHVGVSADLNGDGFICMKHVTLDQMIHVHVDNSLP